MERGFIDIHTHGAVNVDVNLASEEELFKVSTFFASHGVVGWYPTIMTDSVERTEKAILRTVSAMKTQKTGSRILGIHLEGPFLNPAFAGAMPHDLLLDADCNLLEHYQKIADGNIKRMTIAPEVKGASDLIKAFSHEISFSLGHSNATFSEAMAGIKAGAVCTTHTGNAMRLFHQHEAGLLGAAMYSDVWCEVIGDGLHVDMSSFLVLLKVKGPEKICVITDSMSATGMGEGEFLLGGNRVIVKNGDARMADRDVRAGSIITMDRAFDKVRSFTGLADEQIMPMFRDNQVRMLGISL